MREIRVLAVPYELGRLREGVGRGPETLLEHGAEAALACAGASVGTEVIEIGGEYGATGSGDVDAAFALIRAIAERVRSAREAGAFPVVLARQLLRGRRRRRGTRRARPGQSSGSTPIPTSTIPTRRSPATSTAWGSPS